MSTNNYIIPPQQEIDNTFYIPPGLSRFEYPPLIISDDEDVVDDTQVEINDVVQPIGEVVVDTTAPVIDVPATTALPVPDGLTIVSQTLRTGPSGVQVVDVEVDVPDIQGINQFDIRATKTG